MSSKLQVSFVLLAGGCIFLARLISLVVITGQHFTCTFFFILFASYFYNFIVFFLYFSTFTYTFIYFFLNIFYNETASCITKILNWSKHFSLESTMVY